MSYYIYSTMSANVDYAFHLPKAHPKDNMNQIDRDLTITVKGGANVAHGADRYSNTLYTPQGLVTEITDEQYDRLKDHPVFKMHLEKGFLKTEQRKKAVEKALNTMVTRDRSSPKVPGDYPETKIPRAAAVTVN